MVKMLLHFKINVTTCRYITKSAIYVHIFLYIEEKDLHAVTSIVSH